MARLTASAKGQDLTVRQVIVEVGSGLNDERLKVRRILSEPYAKVIVVEHRDQLARFGVERLEAMFEEARGRRIVVADPARHPMIWCAI